MLILSLTSGATTASTAIGLTSQLNTNSALALANNIVSIKTPGIYEVEGTVTMSNSGGNYGISLFVNNESYNEDSYFNNGTDTVTSTIPIYYVLDIAASSTTDYVGITILPVGTPTIVSGTIGIKKIS